MAWQWDSVSQLDGAGHAADLWHTWWQQRGLSTVECAQLLCARDDQLTPEAMYAAGWVVPHPYFDKRSSYFTARCPLGAQCNLPAAAISNNAAAPKVGFGCEVLTIPLSYSVEPMALLFSESTTAFKALDAISNDAAALKKPPLMAIVDGDIAFLHQQFRAADGKTRIRAHWDQTAAVGNAVSPWKVPTSMGYGRELSGSDIDTLIVGKTREAKLYRDLQVEHPAWGHGTQVLSLAAGRRNGAAADAAAQSPIVTVNLPRSAYPRTHGLWLNIYLLDALHYILAQAKDGEAVIVNVSLGGHSGTHDGSTLLERAVDDLIASQKGRLTVVLAAGNGRRAKARAAVELAGAALLGSQTRQAKLAIRKGGDHDTTSNFIEAWCSGAASKVTTRMNAPEGIADPSPSVGPGQFSVLRNENKQVVAMLACTRAWTATSDRVQVLMAVAGTQVDPTIVRAVAPQGEWRMEVGCPDSLRIDAWVARDDSLRETTMPFATQDHVRMDGTMSSLCGALLPVVVGGYVLDQDGRAAMYQDSGEAFLNPPKGARTGPDLCGLATINGDKMVGFLSDADIDELPKRSDGTSFAAPRVARAMAALLQLHGAVPRDRLLTLLKRAETSVPVAPPNKYSWTSDYWLGQS